MGFFSRIKKIWTKEEQSAAEAQTPDAAAPSQAAPEPDKLAADLALALRQAEPKLSGWLAIILDGVPTVSPLLWDRLRFLLTSLEVPDAEAGAFIDAFSKWLAMMEYTEVEQFRGELQYRLALALDLEDEEDERSRLLLKLSQGLAKTKERIAKRLDHLLASHSAIDADFWEELEEILITADIGHEPAAKLLDRLKTRARKEGVSDPARFKDFLAAELSDILAPKKAIKAVNAPEVVLVIGINGVGKTTTIAKLAHRARMQGKKVLIAAGDTFRAAAIEQLEIWAGRADCGFYAKGAGADPAAVAYEALDMALAENYDVLFVDTAGRLHTKTNLMEELKKIERVLAKKHPGAPHRTILVLDATTGQNALSQTTLFNQAVGLDEIVMTKLDGTAKGGVIVGIALEYGVPITFVGLGEKMEDLRPFNGADFAKALLN